MTAWHLVTPEFPPLLGGVSEHSRVLATVAAARGFDVHVWSAAAASAIPGVQVHATLGGFDPEDLSRTGAALDGFPPPRTLVVQWVPHGYGHRGMNVRFARWVAGRAARGDRIDVIVHEPFVEFIGRSWAQPALAIVQRYMTRTVLRAARRVWMSIPGWEARIGSMVRPASGPPRVLPVPGTIPVDPDPHAIAEARARFASAEQFLVGYFGAGGDYAENALAEAVSGLQRRADVAVVCIGRGSRDVADRLRHAVPAARERVHATGTLELHEVSHALQACDLLLQPYIDGVSGRRTTTVSALEHGVPVATTFGTLSEPYWATTPAVEIAPADEPSQLAAAVERLLDPSRNALARSGALTLYASRFEATTALAPLFAD